MRDFPIVSENLQRNLRTFLKISIIRRLKPDYANKEENPKENLNQEDCREKDREKAIGEESQKNADKESSG